MKSNLPIYIQVYFNIWWWLAIIEEYIVINSYDILPYFIFSSNFTRMLWNYAIIFLSLVINVIMLVTWQAKASMKDVQPGATALPAAIDE